MNSKAAAQFPPAFLLRFLQHRANQECARKNVLRPMHSVFRYGQMLRAFLSIQNPVSTDV